MNRQQSYRSHCVYFSPSVSARVVERNHTKVMRTPASIFFLINRLATTLVKEASILSWWCEHAKANGAFGDKSSLHFFFCGGFI